MIRCQSKLDYKKKERTLSQRRSKGKILWMSSRLAHVSDSYLYLYFHHKNQYCPSRMVLVHMRFLGNIEALPYIRVSRDKIELASMKKRATNVALFDRLV